jgi:hypothetical protein
MSMDAVQVDAGAGRVFLIDALDLPRLEGRKWRAYRGTHTWYVTSNGIYLHRFLMDAPDGVEVDHINGNGLDNRRSVNLRLATHQQNLANQGLSRANTSGYRGVIWLKKEHRWRAQLKCAGKFQAVGSFEDIETAAYAYDLAALKVFGPFARCNLIKPGDSLLDIQSRVSAALCPRREYRPEQTRAPHVGSIPQYRPRYGESHPCAKLTADDVRSIRHLFAAQQATKAELARKFGVHIQTIIPVLNGQTWKHVS